MAKKLQIKAVTPAGIAAYAWVTKPDASKKNGGKGEYGDDKYKVTVVVESDDPGLAKLRALCDEAAKAEWGSVPADLKYPGQDGDDKVGKPEFAGKILLCAKSQFQPGCVDAMRQSLKEGTWVSSGDLIKASCVLYPYSKTEKVKDGKKIIDVTVQGVSLQLRNIQLLEKRNGGGNAAADFDDEDEYATDDNTSSDKGSNTDTNAGPDF